MKIYNPYNNQQESNNQYQNFKKGLFHDLQELLIGGILAPISLLAGVVTMATLVLIAFGRLNYWGMNGKILVGIGVPLIIILCLISKPLGNLIFLIWSFLLFLIVVGLPMCAILYVCFKPVFEYLGFNF